METCAKEASVVVGVRWSQITGKGTDRRRLSGCTVGFSASALLTVWASWLFCGGLSCALEDPPSKCDSQKCLQRLSDVPWAPGLRRWIWIAFTPAGIPSAAVLPHLPLRFACRRAGKELVQKQVENYRHPGDGGWIRNLRRAGGSTADPPVKRGRAEALLVNEDCLSSGLSLRKEKGHLRKKPPGLKLGLWGDYSEFS